MKMGLIDSIACLALWFSSSRLPIKHSELCSLVVYFLSLNLINPFTLWEKMSEWAISFYMMSHCKTREKPLVAFHVREERRFWQYRELTGSLEPSSLIPYKWSWCRWSNPKKYFSMGGAKCLLMSLWTTKFIVGSLFPLQRQHPFATAQCLHCDNFATT